METDLSRSKNKILLSRKISIANKMHLATAWDVEWRFQGGGWFEKSGVMPGRMEFFIDNEWKLAQSWDDDVKVKMKDNKNAL